MDKNKHEKHLVNLVEKLRLCDSETECIEFKVNNNKPEEIGQYISALSNSATLYGKSFSYIIWGIEDATHRIVGTKFEPSTQKKGNELLQSWLMYLLEPRLHLKFQKIKIDNKSVVILKVPAAKFKPTRFSGEEYIRVASYKKNLKAYPEMERGLWRKFEEFSFEKLIASEDIDGDEVLSLLDYPRFFEMLSYPLPTEKDGILERLSSEGLIVPNLAYRWNITNLGAILFAKKLSDFQNLSRKAVRVIVYEGKNKLNAIRELCGNKGYASGFEGLVDYINTILPANEVIGKALRKTVPMYPELAIRELVANALIHQDFSLTGCGATIEMFSDRMEITNPGTPLVSTERFLDQAPISRNEALASLMRRAGICEERGSGIDKVVFQTEYYQLPAPIFQSNDNSTKAILFSHKELNSMETSDKTRACYQHSCLRYVSGEQMTNSTLRERFGIEEKNSAIVSRIIRDTLAEKLIKPAYPGQGKKYAKYLPYWA